MTAAAADLRYRVVFTGGVQLLMPSPGGPARTLLVPKGALLPAEVPGPKVAHLLASGLVERVELDAA